MMKRFGAELYTTILTLLICLAGCVPARQVEEIKDNYAKCQNERDALANEKRSLETANAELKSSTEDLKKRLAALSSDTTIMGSSLRTMLTQYKQINKLNDELLRKQVAMQKGKELENKKLMEELQALKTELLKREDELKILARQLTDKRKNLDELSVELAKREQRVKELENLIAQKDAKVKDLKDRITKALRAFEGKGLTIEERNGRIYVSMEAKLLFASGSTTIDKKGQKMLIELAKVLVDQSDLQVLVEGHTDTDKITSNTIPRDNWELSVLRATAVVKIMTENTGINPIQLTAAGRSAFIPVSEDDKEKNRRIEVILTPSLDELYKILEN